MPYILLVERGYQDTIDRSERVKRELRAIERDKPYEIPTNES